MVLPVDGPEGFRGDPLFEDSEVDSINTPSHGYTTESSAADRSTASESPSVELRYLTVGPSQYGSPFACESYRHKEDFFIGLLSENTRILFDQVAAEASRLRGLLSAEHLLTDDGHNPYLCFLKKRKTSSDDTESSEDCDDNESKLILQSLDSSTDNSSLNRDETIEIRRVEGSRDVGVQYFVVNKGSREIFVNEMAVGHYEAVGPLPDFAVFDIDHSSSLWWRTAAALDYDPSPRRKRRSEDDNGELPRKALKGNTGSSHNTYVEPPSPYERQSTSTPQVFTSSKTWLAEYRRRLNICEKRPVDTSSLKTDGGPRHQPSPGEMHDIDVILAIGAVWLGLIDAKVDFAYANSDLFSLARSMRTVGMHAVKGTNHFLMPLLFNGESQALPPESEEDTAEPLEPVFSAFQQGKDVAAAEKAGMRDPGNKNSSPAPPEDQAVQNNNRKSGIGHFVLAIAEKVNTDRANIVEDVPAREALVRLRFMDSANGIVDRGLIRRVARNTVRNSGWLGDIWPRFDAREEYWVDALRQSGNRSGEHTVLNAWAYMLNIPLATTRARALGHPSYKDVRRMIVLALRGQLDSLTIRAWMQHSKYAADEPLSQLQCPDSPNDLRNMQTVALNENAFNEIVNRMYTEEQAGRQSPLQERVTYAPSRTWQGSLNRGITKWRDKKTNHPRTTQGGLKNPTVIRGYSNMADYEVVLGIAPIWEGLKRLGRADFDFTYAGTDVFAPGGDQDKVGAVGGWSRFIMPLFFSNYESGELENQGKGKGTINSVGHLLLCVAELVDVAELIDGPTMTVHLEIFDSSPGSVHIDVITDKAERIIKDSRWLGKKGSRSEILYTYTARPVPHQVGINTCGLHTILNAWAYMLNIPIHGDTLRRGRDEEAFNNTDHRFLQQGLQILNLALAGFMDSTTIQAFFNTYGYSAQQRINDPARAVVDVNAIGMNMEKLRRTIQRYQVEDKLAKARAQNKSFPDADMRTLTEQDISEEDAWKLLVLSKGDVDAALARSYEEVTNPEDALSPTTPDRRRS